MRLLRSTLIVIGIVQLVLGIVFLVPGLFASTMGLNEAPGWVNWLFAMFGARALALAYGMFLAARNPGRHVAWVQAMVGIQAIDWIATIAYLAAGTVTLAQVTTAVFLPLVFIAILGRYLARERGVEPVGQAQAT
ncbi:MAG: hypothetical protein ACC683_02760 [Acidimicrobiia bacterium]